MHITCTCTCSHGRHLALRVRPQSRRWLRVRARAVGRCGSSRSASRLPLHWRLLLLLLHAHQRVLESAVGGGEVLHESTRVRVLVAERRACADDRLAKVGARHLELTPLE